MRVLIKVYHNLQLLTGIGEEWYVNQNDLVMVFVDGNFRRIECHASSSEITRDVA